MLVTKLVGLVSSPPAGIFKPSVVFKSNEKAGKLVLIPILPSGLIIILSSPAVTNCSSSLSAFALDSAFT